MKGQMNVVLCLEVNCSNTCVQLICTERWFKMPMQCVLWPTGADDGHTTHAPHDSRQAGAPGFGLPPSSAGPSLASSGAVDAGPFAPRGGRGFGIGRGRGLKGAVHVFDFTWCAHFGCSARSL